MSGRGKSDEDALRRVLAIVGRPNVGKSAIFNRFCGRRIAIVHEQSGVTRDRLVAEAHYGDAVFEAVDTGGITEVDGAVPDGAIEAGIQQQVDIAVADAAVILLVTDVTRGAVALDEHVARLLRRRGRPVFVVANKADNRGLDEQIDDFHGLGFPVFAVSALHNRGFGALMDAVLPELPDVTNPTVAAPLRVTVAGHPNVGKSSYINRLLHSDRLIVADIPGTTRDSVDVPFVVGRGAQARHYLLTDTPGMRRARKARSAVEKFSLMRAERSIRETDVVVFVVDAQKGPDAHDKKIAALVLKYGKACVVLANKWDLVTGRGQNKYREELAAALQPIAFAPVVFASALTGYNIRKSIETIDYVAGRMRARLPTGLLNRTLAEACAQVTPPIVKGKRFKILYATQTRTQPIRVTLFVNSPRALTAAYARYLVRVLRESFDLYGTPVLLQARARHAQARGKAGRRQRARR